jgi:peptidoglycan/LPS O-acetylase OafA/YrhL
VGHVVHMTTAVDDEPLARPIEEAGTAPGDRPFRPDIQGLRAVAVLLVVFYHAGLHALSGGYVGVDVFFVISGFVITGLLLRERSRSHRTSFLAFYGRRSRRIIPAATVVIAVTVIAVYGILGPAYGYPTAVDARWTAVFLANFHFAQAGSGYLAAQQPQSPLLNFWSLAVEEQFYFVYPLLFLALASIRIRWSLRAKLAVGLGVVIISSFTFSVLQTSSSPTTAYFSPFTRAWELALGALLAVGTKWLLRIPRPVGAAMSWSGLVAIVFAALYLNATTPYPGSLAAVPVLGACLVIAGGTNGARWAAESMLGTAPARWVGKLSYSLYLWHWPILIIAADAAGRSNLPFSRNVVWLLVALGAATASFYLIEAPVRRAALGHSRRSVLWAPIALGVVLTVVSLGVATYELHASSGQSPTSFDPHHLPAPAASESAVDQAVRAATLITSVPGDLTPPLADVADDFGGQEGTCFPVANVTSVPSCTFGDPHGAHTMVLYGDSHADMWFYAMNLIATRSHWKLVLLSKGWCPATMLPYGPPPGTNEPTGEYVQCDQWHQFALRRIRQLHPDLVIVTQEPFSEPGGGTYTAKQWGRGTVDTLEKIPVPASRILVLGDIPSFSISPPVCLLGHMSDVQACSSPLPPYRVQINAAEMKAAARVGARYVSVIPWFCTTTCTAVIGRYEVYYDDYHITLAYSDYLSSVLTTALRLSSYT